MAPTAPTSAAPRHGGVQRRAATTAATATAADVGRFVNPAPDGNYRGRANGRPRRRRSG